MDIAIWPGSASFYPGDTPFGFYDNDYSFQQDAEKVAVFCARRLGYPITSIELQDINFFACFEEAVTTYGNEVFQYKIRENYLSLEGTETGSNINGQLVSPSLNGVVTLAKEYGLEADVGGNVDLHTGSLMLTASVQEYDLAQWAEDQGIEGGIEVRRVFYQAPPAILRYFDPYAGTGTGVQGLMEAFDFGSYSPGINFLLMPINYDVQKIQAIEFNDQIRKSAYSFELHNNKIRLFPVPKGPGYLSFQYYKLADKRNPYKDGQTGLVTNVGDVPYSNPSYCKINSVGKQWIYSYTLALSKELLAYIRGKYQDIPVPEDVTRLNQADLLTDSRQEKLALITQLRDTLEQASRKEQLARKAEESDNLSKTLKNVPLPIYVG